ncbi:MAG: hypothetical protein AM1032_000140 [Mycoplasmataceae bacterium]|nr:MAG: hypothetical protein AM1032_000140 [Mycoplasmataceae bacterium]
MNKREIIPITPAEVIIEEILTPNGITTEQLAHEIKMSISEVNRFLINNDRLTADFISRLNLFFGISKEFFYNLQNHYEDEMLNYSRDWKTFNIKPFIYKSNSLTL